jgi:hypothetical protein
MEIIVIGKNNQLIKRLFMLLEVEKLMDGKTLTYLLSKG